MATEAQRKANRRYKEKNKENINRLTVDFYPTEAALWEQVSKQPNKQGYIKALIRADMERGGE